MANSPMRAMVLSGGGARGAYEVGVLAYICQELPQKLLERGRLEILSGTSVGAVHACFLAGTAHLPQYNIQSILNVWRSLKLESLLRFGVLDLARLPFEMRAMFSHTSASNSGMLINSCETFIAGPMILRRPCMARLSVMSTVSRRLISFVPS